MAIEKDSVFPYAWIDRKNGELIDDLDIIEKMEDSKYRYRYRAASPINLHRVSDAGEKIFDDVVSAVRYYIAHVLHLPGDLDGWKAVEK